MGARLRVEWSRRSVKDVDRIILYLKEKWTDREVRNFLELVIITVFDNRSGRDS